MKDIAMPEAYRLIVASIEITSVVEATTGVQEYYLWYVNMMNAIAAR